jgi:hypothetical protein
MTREQIIGNVVIASVVGLFLIVVGAVLQPLLKRLWERMNRPSPLTPQTKGQLVTNLAIWESELERLNYLSTHAKDLFLRLIQLVMVTLLFSIAAFWLYVFRTLDGLMNLLCGDQRMRDGVDREGDPVLHADFVHQFRDVSLHRALYDAEG